MENLVESFGELLRELVYLSFSLSNSQQHGSLGGIRFCFSSNNAFSNVFMGKMSSNSDHSSFIHGCSDCGRSVGSPDFPKRGFLGRMRE